MHTTCWATIAHMPRHGLIAPKPLKIQYEPNKIGAKSIQKQNAVMCCTQRWGYGAHPWTPQSPNTITQYFHALHIFMHCTLYVLQLIIVICIGRGACHFKGHSHIHKQRWRRVCQFSTHCQIEAKFRRKDNLLSPFSFVRSVRRKKIRLHYHLLLETAL